MQFVSRPIEPVGAFDTDAMSRGEPPLPDAFLFDGERLDVALELRRWRSTKDDRGDTYLKRHWFEFETSGGRRAVVYFDRAARRNHARWWLYTIETVD